MRVLSCCGALGMEGKTKKMLAAKNELVDRLKSVITDSADDILLKTLNKLSESPGPDKRKTRGGEGMPRSRVSPRSLYTYYYGYILIVFRRGKLFTGTFTWPSSTCKR